jgi:hypothetical protein
MLSFFKSPTFRDPQLGEFERSRGHWRGLLELGGKTVPLALVGGRSEPDTQALQLARTVSPHFPAWRPTIAEALFEHYQPYAEAVATGEAPPPSTPLPRIGAPSDVWPHTALVFVSVTPIDRVLAVEFGFTTAWDEEHILGARFQGGKLLELNGSVLPP